MNRFKGRPARGLPGELPAGETVLWQGAPDWRSLARRAFRIRVIAAYFGLLITWRVAAGLVAGHSLGLAAASGLSGLLLGAAATAMFCVFAWLISRTTVYTITSRRVVITYGTALPKSLNLPFGRIEAADVRLHEDGSGDIALKLPAKARLSYLLLWPHVRSGAQGRNQPVLRCIPNAEATATLLSRALGATLGGVERQVSRPVPADAGMVQSRPAQALPAEARAA